MHSYNRSITSISIINCPFPHISLLTNNIDRVSSVNEELEELKKGIKLIEEMLNKHKPEEGQEEDTFLNTMRISFPLFILPYILVVIISLTFIYLRLQRYSEYEVGIASPECKFYEA